jgi:hypothetical protein
METSETIARIAELLPRGFAWYEMQFSWVNTQEVRYFVRAPTFRRILASIKGVPCDVNVCEPRYDSLCMAFNDVKNARLAYKSGGFDYVDYSVPSIAFRYAKTGVKGQILIPFFYDQDDARSDCMSPKERAADHESVYVVDVKEILVRGARLSRWRV